MSEKPRCQWCNGDGGWVETDREHMEADWVDREECEGTGMVLDEESYDE